MTPQSPPLVAPSTLDDRRRLRLPIATAAAAGLRPGLVTVLPGDEPGEIIVATPRAALRRLHRALGAALAAAGRYATLADAFHAQTAGALPAPPVGRPVTVPPDGPIFPDTAALLALLDGNPAAEPLVDLLPRLLLVDAVTDELFTAVLAAGLPVDPSPEQPVAYRTVMDYLSALGVRARRLDRAEWTQVAVLEFQLRSAGVSSPSERAVLAIAQHLRATALVARPVDELPTAVDYRDLTAEGMPA